MTWNVRYFAHGTGGLVATRGHLRRAAEVVAGYEPLPHVLALQELEDGSLRGGPEPQASRFGDALNGALAKRGRSERFVVHYFPAHRYEIGPVALYTTGLATLVHDGIAVEAVDQSDITHVRLAAFRRFKQRRIAGRLRLRPRGWARPIDIVNTHLSLPAFLEVGSEMPRRMGHGTNQLREVEALLAAVRGHEPLPTVVVGDFNSSPGSPVVARMLAAGWSAPRWEAAPTLAFFGWRLHVDHVFASPGVRVTSARCHSVDAPPFRGLSDHAPKVARLVVEDL